MAQLPAPYMPGLQRSPSAVLGIRPSEVSTAVDGAFSVDLPAAIYEVTARSLRYQGGAAVCDPAAGGAIGAQPGRTIDIQIDCEAR